MKKGNIVFLGLVSLGIVGGAIAIGVYSWRQATYLPDWYVSDAVASDTRVADSDSPRETIERKIIREVEYQRVEQSTGSQPQTEEFTVSLDQQDVNDLFVSAIAQRSEGKALLQSAKGVQATIKEDTVEFGAVVNPRNLSLENLNPNQKKTVNQVIQSLPGMSNRDIYVGIEGDFQIQQGQLQLDENAKVKLGNVTLSLQEVAQRMGISPEELAKQLNLNLDSQLQDLNISDVEVRDYEALIKGSFPR